MSADRNPFDVLGVAPCAGRVEIERAAQRLLAEASLGVLGDGDVCAVREHEVRRALDELRDPRRRLVAEVLSRALLSESLDARAFHEIGDAVQRAALAPRPPNVAVAEEMLWASIEFPPPYELPSDYAERKRVAFGCAVVAAPPPLLSFDDVDWDEVVGVPRVATKPRGS